MLPPIRRGAVAVLWHPNDDVRIESPIGPPRLFTVLKRVRGGYVLGLKGGEETLSLTDDQIRDARCAGELEHYPCAPDGLSEQQYEMLRKAYDTNSPEHQMVAEVRADYCRRVDDLLEMGVPFDDAYAMSAEKVRAENIDRWTESFERIRTVRDADARRRRRLPDFVRVKKAPRLGLGSLEPIKPSTVETWFRNWTLAAHDIRILVPMFVNRGEQGSKLSLHVCERMRFMIDNHYLRAERAPLTYAFRKLTDELGPVASYTTFRNFMMREYKPYFVEAKRLGVKKAYLRFHVFQRILHNQKALDEVEVDHCLLDVIIRNDHGNVIGRPWLTVIIDRATRMILGCHLSFDVPSYATLQRCIVHAFWPKDLRGLDLVNDWPCEGIAKRMFTDRGKEFVCLSLKRTETALGFALLNLQGRTPWLKGIIERLFRTIGIKVMSWQEGKTFSNSLERGDYNSVKKSKHSLKTIKTLLLKFIVDDYHVSWHEGLQGVPLTEWYKRQPEKGVRPLKNPTQIIESTGVFNLKKLYKNGISLYGQKYTHV